MNRFHFPRCARRLIGCAALAFAAAAATTAAHALVPPPVPDDLHRYVDPRLANLPFDQQRLTLMLNCPTGAVLRFDQTLRRFVCRRVEEQAAAPRCPRPDLSALHALQFTADVCSRPDVAIPPRAPLLGVPAGTYEFLPQNGLRNGLSYVNHPDPNGWQLQIDPPFTASDRYRRTVTTITAPTSF